MTTGNEVIIVLAFTSGISVGCIAAYVLMRRAIKQNMKSLSKIVNDLNKHRKVKEKDFEARKDNILLLTNKLKQIESNIHKIRSKDYNEHISGLNKLLGEIGIGRISQND